ncbi:DUF465 domain-containing protein [Pseudohalioglobus sediminis]|uniref:DUF465 domain-containing protein n=1 Tax=Pseudohalioglobus sediminis TaxID=2606449 RepID=A0A5B0WPP6_9GAMM|nr:DUF465 domain-containing protein [Pseudohalioglobus sediminis]KAA1188517.1 DUF465 domain-containing protein [Pseudohalioglobus sediminis]
MSVEHHDLHHDFPELNDQIHEMKMNNAHFRRLFDEYHELTRTIEKMEDEVTPVSTRTEEEAKLRRVHLKDELYRMLTAA